MEEVVPVQRYNYGPMAGQYPPPPGAFLNQQPQRLGGPVYQVGMPMTGEYPMMPPKPREKKMKRKKTCWEEFKTVLALIAFCISIILKGVAYSNSHWTNSDHVDLYKNLEKFPIMTQFLDRTNGNYASDCEEQKCKIFFGNYNAQRTVNEKLGKSPPPLSGTYARGANSRCETIETGPGVDSSSVISSVTGAAKYERCAVDKEREVNDYKTVRVLLIVSMVSDGAAILSWVVTFVKDSSTLIGRAALAVAWLLGFISTLLTALTLGLFAGAVDIFEDNSLTLGWPFYIVLVACVLAFITTILAAWQLYEGRQRELREERAKTEAMYGPTEDQQRDPNQAGFEEFQRQQRLRYQQEQRNKAIAPPPPRRNDEIEDIEDVEVHHHHQRERNEEEAQRETPLNKQKTNKPTQFDSRDYPGSNRNRDDSPRRDDDNASSSGNSLRRGGDPPGPSRPGGRGPFQAI